jgi:hypothetical protein
MIVHNETILGGFIFYPEQNKLMQQDKTIKLTNIHGIGYKLEVKD